MHQALAQSSWEVVRGAALLSLMSANTVEVVHLTVMIV